MPVPYLYHIGPYRSIFLKHKSKVCMYDLYVQLEGEGKGGRKGEEKREEKRGKGR